MFRKIVAVTVVMSGALFASDGFVGTWKVSQSNMSPIQTDTWEATADGYRIVSTRRAPNGKIISGSRLLHLDGKYRPEPGPGPERKITYRRKDLNTITMEGRENNKENGMTAVFRGQWMISGDRRTMTYTVQSIPSSGQQFNGTTVFSKQ
jgi:hypothetical protein